MAWSQPLLTSCYFLGFVKWVWQLVWKIIYRYGSWVLDQFNWWFYKNCHIMSLQLSMFTYALSSKIWERAECQVHLLLISVSMVGQHRLSLDGWVPVGEGHLHGSSLMVAETIDMKTKFHDGGGGWKILGDVAPVSHLPRVFRLKFVGLKTIGVDILITGHCCGSQFYW